MKFEKINGWLTLVANFGVLIGIVLLIVELNQNQKMMKSQVRNEIATEIVDILYQIASNKELANIRRRGDAGDSLSVDEYYRYDHIVTSFFRYWENVHFQYRNGLYDEGEFEYHMKAIMSAFQNNPGVQKLWCDTQDLFASEFKEDINAKLKSLGIQCK